MRRARAPGVGSAMLKRLEHAWRIVATGIAFAVFGVGGLLLACLCFPLLRVLVGDAGRRRRIARLTIHHCFRLMVGFMEFLGLCHVRIVGEEKLARSGLLILANHPSLIDVVLLIALVPNADCVVKSSLAESPFVRGPIRAADYICNDSGGAMIDACVTSIRSGNNLIIFPEGTRTPAAGEIILRRGAANIAVRGGCNITPVSIGCAPRGLVKGVAWWKVADRCLEFTVEVRDDIPVTPFIERAGGEAPLAARHLTDFLQSYFSMETAIHAGA